jgi:hypothetical protein
LLKGLSWAIMMGEVLNSIVVDYLQ